MNRLTLIFPMDHPTGAGHFQGNPIIPGALLLAEVLRCIEQAEKMEYTSCEVKSAKFPSPARPGDTVVIEYECSANGRIEFQCAVNDNKVLSGGIVAGKS